MIKMQHQKLFFELKHHVPFTMLSTAGVFAVFALLTGLVFATNPNIVRETYEIAHTIHIFISAVATTAMFWRYEKKFAKAMGVGLVGSLVICAAGDILFPYLGAWIMGFPVKELHICLLEHPHTIVPLAIGGALIGIFAVNKIAGKGLAVSIFSHSGHIIISVVASLAFLLYFGGGSILEHPVPVFVIVLLSILIPCVISDIVFPMLMRKNKSAHANMGCCGTA
ncbi:MAG: hypothetical protein LR006_04590 [Dehalococcoidia bacterium]|nr:hypothetical protein [Dehalococcoidia bacterium]